MQFYHNGICWWFVQIFFTSYIEPSLKDHLALRCCSSGSELIPQKDWSRNLSFSQSNSNNWHLLPVPVLQNQVRLRIEMGKRIWIRVGMQQERITAMEGLGIKITLDENSASFFDSTVLLLVDWFAQSYSTLSVKSWETDKSANNKWSHCDRS